MLFGGPQWWAKLNNEELFGAQQSREKSGSRGKYSTQVNWTVWQGEGEEEVKKRRKRRKNGRRKEEEKEKARRRVGIWMKKEGSGLNNV